MSFDDIGTHDALRATLAEYALGILDGRTRAVIVGHLETCEECRGDLAALTATADALVHVPVPVDPPLGFESRVIERIRASAAPPAQGGARLVRWAAAAAVLAAFGVGWAVENATSTSPHQATAHGPVIERNLVASGRTVGSIYVDAGRPNWMFVSLDAPSAPSRVKCIIVTKSGRHELVGTFALTTGYGAWGTKISVPWSSVHTVDITTMSGIRLATSSSSAWSTSTSTQ